MGQVGLQSSTQPNRAGDKGDLTKNVDQVCVWYRWKGYLSGIGKINAGVSPVME